MFKKILLVVLLPAIVSCGNSSNGDSNNDNTNQDGTTTTLDSDGDGVADTADAFPNDATETLDTDSDGVGDNADAFPNDASETLDTDGDGVGDNADAFPNDATETLDTDGDGVGDNSDVFPKDATETLDSDGDGIGDNADSSPNDSTAFNKPTTYDAVAVSITDLITKLLAASPGDVIALANGTYNNVNLNINTDDVTVVAETSGSVFIEGASFVNLRGDNIVFEGFTFQNGQPADRDGAIIISGNHNRVTNCKIDSFNDNDPNNSYKWVSLDNDATFGQVDHCTFTGKNTEGSLLVVWRDNDSRQDHHIYRNIFSDYQYRSEDDINNDSNGWEAIRIGTSSQSQSSSYTIVESNYFHDINGEIEIISNKSGHNIYRFNTFESSEGLLTLRHGNNCTVDSNYFLIDNNRGGGVRVIGEGHTISNNYIEGANSTSSARGGITLSSSETNPALSGYWPVRNVTLLNNTIINSKQSLHFGASSKENAPSDVTISNNLIRNNIDNNGDYDFIRVSENNNGVPLNIINPTYVNNYFYGSSNLGLPTVPTGINLSEVALTQNANGQYFAQDATLNVGAPELKKLDFDSEVGSNF
ncbi:polysaccharide lyase 6 family protein [Thalassomonas sp. M1454]|uniref:polysaccharide lyase 6 family protein n=1 Tax=Thalassomonas sp. M1454 TaxID=2594477 RepID=UPI00163DD0D5|nr:polysaccharide lyase 6 family protein [Thalassomonas sp. M1454]